MDLKLDSALLSAALKKIVLQSAEVSKPDVDVMVANPEFRAYVISCATRLAESHSGPQLFSVIATIFHLGMETGVAYRELERPN